MTAPTWRSVPVTGGRLAVAEWPGSGPVVLAVHGITSNALCWQFLAEALGGSVRLVAPDLRGRALSRELPGPYGLTVHVSDLLEVLRHLHRRRVIVVGHSMGAYVAALFAARHPHRVKRLILVDGGVGFPPPPGSDIDAMLAAILGPALARLGMRFPSRAAYSAFWRAHPAFANDWSPLLERHLQHDLIGQPPQLRSSCVLEVVRADGADVLKDEETLTAVHRLRCPTTLLWAARGLLNEPPGLLGCVLERAELDSRIAVHQVENVNHYTILLSERGAKTIAQYVRPRYAWVRRILQRASRRMRLRRRSREQQELRNLAPYDGARGS
jgi:pimeloyl-ACP methyl ester carboxylesterase